MYIYPRIPKLKFYLVVKQKRCKTLHLHQYDVLSMNAMFDVLMLPPFFPSSTTTTSVFQIL